ncbi:MAG: hypothetical protein ACYC39_12255 [Thiobacillus sp.]|nr:DUF3597 domain-containing protein [Gammaproteobacteria bacterium]HQT34347.1 hypothetical protein [Thiobacillus sp.]
MKRLDIDTDCVARKDLATEPRCPAADGRFGGMNMWRHKTVLTPKERLD